MSKTSASPGNSSAGDLLDRWLAHHEGEQSPAEAEHPTTPGVTAPAEPETVEAATPVPAPTPAPPGPGHLGSAAGAPSSAVRERRSASTPPRDGRPVPGATRASAAATPVPPTATPAPAKSPTPVRRPPVAPAPGTVLTSPSRGVRRALALLALVAAVAAAGTGWLAWSARTPLTAGVAAGLAFAAFLLWRASRRPVTVVSVENGELRIVQGHTRHAFPLDKPYPPIDVLGDPAGRGWKVLIQRRSMSPYVIDRSMVDPRAFTELIRYHRPNA